MDDSKIIDLYWQRQPQAIEETAARYGAFCYGIARNILSLHEDAEECVNDTYHQVWNAIPPQRPLQFRPWLGRITRNTAINLWQKNRAQKRYAGAELLLDELSECIPAPGTVEETLTARELADSVERWLRSLDREDRTLFLRRYWYGVPLHQLARERHTTAAKLSQRMFSLRGKLKTALEQEGFI